MDGNCRPVQEMVNVSYVLLRRDLILYIFVAPVNSRNLSSLFSGCFPGECKERTGGTVSNKSMKQLELLCLNDSECMAFDYKKGSTLAQSIGSKCRSTKSEPYKTATGFQICPIKKGVLVFLELLFL